MSYSETSNAKNTLATRAEYPIARIWVGCTKSAQAGRLAPRRAGGCQHNLHSEQVLVIGCSIQKTSKCENAIAIRAEYPIARIWVGCTESAQAGRLAPRRAGGCPHSLHSNQVRVIGCSIQKTSSEQNALAIRAIRYRASCQHARNTRKPGGWHRAQPASASIACIRNSSRNRSTSENVQCERYSRNSRMIRFRAS
jgi:hypothetical protein